MTDYRFSLPWPPSINGYWRSFRGRQIISKDGREFRKLAISMMKDAGLFGEKLPNRLSVAITLNPKTMRRYDVDNFAKPILDALTHAEFWLDDDQVYWLTIIKGEKVAGGRVDLTVTILE